jgi:hypothetical protein
VRYDILALAVILLAVLAWLYRRHRTQAKASRAAVFDACLDLFSAYRIEQDDVDYPVLRGSYRGYHVILRPVVDQMAFRKLPSLWLLVTLRAPVPVRGSFDLLMRASNVEFYSPSSTLPVTLDAPPGWPEHGLIRCDDPQAIPPLSWLSPHVAFFDQDPRAKEMVITPNGVRLVYQIDEATRAHYLVLRQAVFEKATLAPDLAKDLLERAVALYEDLRARTRRERRSGIAGAA